MTWFERLTGIREESPDHVGRQLVVDGRRLHSRVNGRSWQWGELETPTLEELRRRVGRFNPPGIPNSVREVVANVQHLHQDPTNANALFQVASHLEMASPGVTPEAYFAAVNGKVGQTVDNQVDCLADVGELLDNSGQRLWQMINGYAIASEHGLQEINQQLTSLDARGLDRIRQAVRIGLQWDTEVTLCDELTPSRRPTAPPCRSRIPACRERCGLLSPRSFWKRRTKPPSAQPS